VKRASPLAAFGLHGIKTQITAFALLATLIPSLTMGWLSYVQNRQVLTEKITQELQSVTLNASRELDLWLKERLYDLRVFASSYVVTENLEKLLAPGQQRFEGDPSLRRLRDYLRSVRGKFADYEELGVVAPDGTVVATSGAGTGTFGLPPDWLRRARSGESTLGDPSWDQALGANVMTVAVPIVSANERFLGVLVAKQNFKGVAAILKGYAGHDLGGLYLLAPGGPVITASQPPPGGFAKARLALGAVGNLFAREGVPLVYRGYTGAEVIGALRRVPNVQQGVVAEKDRAQAFAEIYRLRNVTVGLALGLLVGVGVLAYLLGLTIVRPLDRLIRGAAQVASGDLGVRLPLSGGSELGYMTTVFNDMVEQLRQGRAELDDINQTLRQRNRELQDLSVTDSLTGLFNRKHVWETLALELAAYDHHRRPLSVLMIDIDHFKLYNDANGHLAGDDVLRRMAEVFRGSLRGSDYAARHGGEEFLVVLPETDAATAAQVAERIRNLAAAEEFPGKTAPVTVTVSVGVAQVNENDSPESLVRSADTALYRAKQLGRNRVVVFDDPVRLEAAPPGDGEQAKS
jgi:diguanylate cyclase (GGDEF)-like protein